MSTKSLTDDEIEKVKKSIDLYEKIIQELGGSSSPTSASSSVASSAAAPGPSTSSASTSSASTSSASTSAASTSVTPPASSSASAATSPTGGPDGPDGADDSSTTTGKKSKNKIKSKKVKSDTSPGPAEPGTAAAAAAPAAASTLTYSTDQENIINDLKLNKTIFEELEKIRKEKEKTIQPPPDTDGIFGMGAHKFTGSILSGLNEKTGNNVWLKKDGFFVSKDGENYENQAIIGEPAVESTGDFNGKNNTRYYKFKNQVLGSLMQQGKIRTGEAVEKLGISGGKTLKKRKGRSRKTKRK